MLQEILVLINNALYAMDEVENNVFYNHRAKYVYTKTILDNYREEIDEIKEELNGELTEQSASELKDEIRNMTDSVLDAKETGMINPVTSVETFDSTIDKMINDLDNNNLETVFPTASIDVQAIENAIPTFNNVEVAALQQSSMPNTEEQVPTVNVFEGLEILEGPKDMAITNEIPVTIFPETKTTNIPAMEPIIELQNFQVPNSSPIIDITQQTGA